MLRTLKPSIRTLFAFSFASIGVLATLGLGVLATCETSERLRTRIGADLAELATHMADRLARGMFERWRDIQVAASLDVMRDPTSSPEAQLGVIERLRSTYPDYAAIAFINPDARVKVATVPGMQGVSVAEREFFLKGREAPFVGDVRDALLLANMLGNDPANPPRFADIVAPVKGRDGLLVGLLGAHLYWKWAEEIEASLLKAADARYPEIDVLVLARDGTVLLGPKALHRTVLTTASANAARAGGAGSAVESSGQQQEYLTGYRQTVGYRDYPGLGWSVLVRQPSEASFAPVTALQWSIAFWAVVVAGLTALAGWLLAGYIARPLRALAGSAQALGDGGAVMVPRTRLSEVEQVGQALLTASRELGERHRQQELLVNELNHRVKNTLATIQSMAALTAKSAPTSGA
jgi:two-component sensor histidine kinase